MSRGRRALIALATASAALAAAAGSASATFHMISIREVYPGSAAAPEAEYVELQMYASGQNLLQGHSISLFGAAGAPTGKATFGSDASGAANQSTLVAATPAAESQFEILADTGMPAGSLDPSGGAACWELLDCVAWGSFHGSALSPVGSLADPSGIPDGMALRRTIKPNCPTLLEGADDRNDSAADFFDAFPAPRPNSVPPSEHVCASQGPGSGGGRSPGGAGNGGGGRPRTSIRKGPPPVSRRRTATFRFASSVPGSTFACKLDGRRFSRCRSPHTLHGLSVGRHVFRVAAKAPGGATDRSPAAWRFRILAKRPVELNK